MGSTLFNRMTGIALVMVLLTLTLGACASAPSIYDPTKSHHRPDGFVNLHGMAGGKSLGDLIRWRWQAWRAGKPAAPSGAIKGYDGFEVVKPALDRLRANGRQPTVTWIGHATVLLQLGGLNILTDPHFSRRASPSTWFGPERKVPLPVGLAELPRIDLVVISHNHPDSLDESTVHMLREQPGGPPLFLVPLGIDRWLANEGINRSQALDWWDRYDIAPTKDAPGIKAWLVPAQHWSARGLFDRNETLWGGWVLEAGGYRVYFAGDTGYSRHFAEIGARFGGFDLSLIPIGAYEPRWFMKDHHINPEEAIKAHLDVKSGKSIAIHWGTFELTDEPLDQPLIDLAAAKRKYGVGEAQFVVLKHGQTVELTQ